MTRAASDDKSSKMSSSLYMHVYNCIYIYIYIYPDPDPDPDPDMNSEIIIPISDVIIMNYEIISQNS